MYKVYYIYLLIFRIKTLEGLFAEVWQLIACIKFCQFFYTTHGVKKLCQTWHCLIIGRITRCHGWHHFLTQCQVSKSCQTFMLQSIAQLRQTSLHFFRRKTIIALELSHPIVGSYSNNIIL